MLKLYSRTSDGSDMLKAVSKILQTRGHIAGADQISS